MEKSSISQLANSSFASQFYSPNRDPQNTCLVPIQHGKHHPSQTVSICSTPSSPPDRQSPARNPFCCTQPSITVLPLQSIC